MLGCLERVQELITTKHSCSECLEAAAVAVAAEAASAAGSSAPSNAFEAIGAGQRVRQAAQKAEEAAVVARAARKAMAAQLEEVNKALEAKEAEAARLEEEVCFLVEPSRGRSRAPLPRFPPDFGMCTRACALRIDPHANSLRKPCIRAREPCIISILLGWCLSDAADAACGRKCV